jgi:hypothetical protein
MFSEIMIALMVVVYKVVKWKNMNICRRILNEYSANPMMNRGLSDMPALY